MSQQSTLNIFWAADDAEAVADLVAEYLVATFDSKIEINVVLGSIDATPPPDAICVMSMAGDVGSKEPFASISENWRNRLTRLRNATSGRIVLMTLFRGSAEGHSADQLYRIRQLNLLAVELSRALDIEIADVDQICALIGAELLGCDYRCDSPGARRVVQRVVGAAILNLDLTHVTGEVPLGPQSSLMQFVAGELA